MGSVAENSVVPQVPRPPTDLEARYGRRPAWSPAKRRVLAIVGVCAAVISVIAFYRWWASAQETFGARVQSFSVMSDTAAIADIEVTNPEDLPLRCEIVAKDRLTQVVGTSIVETGAQPDANVGDVIVVATSLTTTGRAVVVVVRDCTPTATRVP